MQSVMLEFLDIHYELSKITPTLVMDLSTFAWVRHIFFSKVPTPCKGIFLKVPYPEQISCLKLGLFVSIYVILVTRLG